jgi:ATP-dependent Clp protease protease subunit
MNQKTETQVREKKNSKVPRRFWNWAKGEETGVRTLYINGIIAEESWYGDEVTPALFRRELHAGSGDIEILINSVGGDCIAAAQIYNMLMDYPHNITVKIDGIAASAASVIAMAGNKVLMSPVSLIMVHNPLTVAIGDSEEMQRAVLMLDEVKESILNAYEIKTNLSRVKLSHLMDGETWMSANKAVELGFADGILFRDNEEPEENPLVSDSFTFSRRAVTNSLLDKLKIVRQPQTEKAANTGVRADDLYKRLDLIK